MERFNLSKLLRFCRKEGLSFSLHFSEPSDELEIEIFSAAPAERFYMKRAPSTDYFIQQWKKSLKENLEKMRSN